MKRTIIVLFIFLAANAFAAQDELNVLKRRASQYKVRRQFEKAVSVYESVLKNNPNDAESIRELILLLIQTSKLAKADSLLVQYQPYLAHNIYLELNLVKLLHKAEFKQAKELSREILATAGNMVSRFGAIARIFENYRQYDTAIEIYLEARKISNDNYLYCRELAFSYQALENYQNAVEEFIKLVEQRNTYSYYVLNSLKVILADDRTVINIVKNTAGKNADPKIREIYALCLGEIGEYDLALEEYANLPENDLLKFGNRLWLSGNLEIALKAYNSFLDRSLDIIANVKTKIKIAEILLTSKELDKAEEILIGIYHDNEIKLPSNRYKTRANRECREMLAEINLMKKGSVNSVLQYLEEAKDFTFNKKGQNEIEYKIIDLLIMYGENAEAENKLNFLLVSENPGSDMYKKGYYYSFLLAIINGDAKSDSLLGELLINLPGDAVTNDALLLQQYKNKLNSEKELQDLMVAVRKQKLYKYDEAIKIMVSVYEETKEEYCLILAAEWAMQIGDHQQAVELLSHKFVDEDLKHYAALKLVEMEKSSSKKDIAGKNFLKEHSGSIFSPQFRKFLVLK
ncbi:MAG: hypothetical protein K9N07_08825 [Candidatus Cloacimonetes bacterium]|nr:hypothetical protein [Candidatus Cloacimonadota bacterium]